MPPPLSVSSVLLLLPCSACSPSSASSGLSHSLACALLAVRLYAVQSPVINDKGTTDTKSKNSLSPAQQTDHVDQRIWYAPEYKLLAPPCFFFRCEVARHCFLEGVCGVKKGLWLRGVAGSRARKKIRPRRRQVGQAEVWVIAACVCFFWRGPGKKRKFGPSLNLSVFFLSHTLSHVALPELRLELDDFQPEPLGRVAPTVLSDACRTPVRRLQGAAREPAAHVGRRKLCQRPFMIAGTSTSRRPFFFLCIPKLYCSASSTCTSSDSRTTERWSHPLSIFGVSLKGDQVVACRRCLLSLQCRRLIYPSPLGNKSREQQG